MRRIDICNLLKGDISPERFSEIYREELLQHLALLNKKGASASIAVVGREHIFVTEKNLRRVLDYVAAGSVSRELFSYLVDALSLDRNVRFADNKLREMVLDLADSGMDRR